MTLVDDHLATHQASRIICIAGPTASGKTALSLALAEALGGEIINADSVQLFRGFDIGAAKASEQEQARVPHHGLDVLEPDGEISAAEFAERADGWIADVQRRGRVPILVGGSGLYLRALIYGLSSGPPRDDDLRDALRDQARMRGTEALHGELSEVDPDYAAKIHPNDLLRIVRALEVYRLTGKPLSGHHSAVEDQPRYDVAGVALTAERAWLYERINRRSQLMLEAGLVEEVRALRAQGVSERAQAMAAIGYRQTMRWLQQPECERDLAALEEEIAARTRNFAKRQMVWFRKEPVFRWFDAAHPERWQVKLTEGLRAFLQSGAPLDVGARTPEAALVDAEEQEGR